MIEIVHDVPVQKESCTEMSTYPPGAETDTSVVFPSDFLLSW